MSRRTNIFVHNARFRAFVMRRGSYARASGLHDEDESGDHRSPVHLITSRFPVTRQISISPDIFARLSTYIQRPSLLFADIIKRQRGDT